MKMLTDHRPPTTVIAEDRRPKTEDKIENGFTLVEILIVMAIMAIMGTILVSIFANTLRGSNKAQILAVIKQNGQAVLDNMSKTIRDADNVVCATPSKATLVTIQNGVYTRYRFIAPSLSPNPIQNGQIQQDNPVQPDPPAGNSDIKLFVNSLCTTDTDPLGIPSGSTVPVALTDTNPQSGVSVINGSFTKNNSSGFKDSVTIQFALKPGVLASQSVTSQIDDVVFQTTVQLR